MQQQRNKITHKMKYCKMIWNFFIMYNQERFYEDLLVDWSKRVKIKVSIKQRLRMPFYILKFNMPYLKMSFKNDNSLRFSEFWGEGYRGNEIQRQRNGS